MAQPPSWATTRPGGALPIPDRIPETTNGLPVTCIADAAFHSGRTLTSITIPNSVTNIGTVAFEVCTSLTSVTIGTNVTSIGEAAFRGCTGLTNITIPNSVTSIGQDAFSGCSSLTNITLGSGVTSIGNAAFSSCTNLTGITIALGVTTLGIEAFSSFPSLISVTIPSSVTNIEVAAFSGFPNVLAIVVDVANPSYSSLDGVLFNKSQTALIRFPAGKAETSYTIPKSVTSIRSYAFEATGLTTVTIGTNVTSIGDYAFSGCTSLTSATIPNSVTNIGVGAFQGCSSLTAITVDTRNPVYSDVDGVLFNRSLTTLIQCPGGEAGSYTIPDSVTSIGDEAFSTCENLTSVTIPNSVTSIGTNAFAGCTSLISVYCEGNAPTVDQSAFSGDSDTVYYLAGTTGWGPAFAGLPAFLWDPLSQAAYTTTNGVITITGYTGSGGAVTIPGTITGLPVTSIGTNAFAGCSSLTSVTIGTNVTSIGDNAFYDCSGLTSVTIPNSVTNIEDNAFGGCTSLTSVYFQGNAPSFGADVFDQWIGWGLGGHRVWDPATIYFLPGTTGWSANSSGLPTVVWPPQVQTSAASFGVRTNQFGFTITWARGMTVVVEATTNLANPRWYPLQTNTLSADSFYFSDPQWTNYPARFYRLRSDLPAAWEYSYTTNGGTVTIKGYSGPGGAVTIPSTINGLPVTSIGGGAFEYCSSLTSITIPDSVTSIGTNAFANCGSLTSVTIGNRVTSIGAQAFYECPSLTAVYFQGNAPNANSSLFSTGGNAIAYYLPGTTGWGDFSANTGLPTSLWFLPNPLILTTGPSFGVQTNGFGFIISWAENAPVIVEARTSLANPTWYPISTNTLTSGSAYFSDPQWTNYHSRFYRLRSNAALNGMALIPAGSFTMGDTLDGDLDATPISVTVSAFYMDVNLVSYSQWQGVYNWATSHGYGFVHAGAGKAANHPVQTVDWYDCVKWCNARSQQAGKTPVYYTDAGMTQVYTSGEVTPYVNWSAQGYRLPTEAEWEKAARGGLSGQRFPWGDTISESQANYYGDTARYSYDLGPSGYNPAFTNGGYPYTSPVGSFAPNGYGLYDMAGNLWEWCWDWLGTPYAGGTNPRGSASGSFRVNRGGDCFNVAYWCRTAARDSDDPANGFDILGFRSVLPSGQ